MVGGLTGGALVFLGGYGYYHFSGAKTMVNTAHQTKQYFEAAQKRLSDSAPEPNEALKWLRQTATSYAAFIPGAKSYVDSAFNDLDAIQAKHGDEVDQVVRKAYDEIKAVTKDKGMSVETATQVWEILQHRLQQIGDLAGDAAQDILNNHPELQAKVGGNLEQLKSLGDKYGPDAKKQVDQTWDQIRDIVKAGVSVETATKIRALVHEKMELVTKMGDEAWQKGLEQAKPYLDKSPAIKKLVEDNADALKQGNVAELWATLKDAASSGNTDAVQQYIQSATGKAHKSSKGGNGAVSGGGLDQYLHMVPGADKILPTLSRLQDIGQKHGKEAEDLLAETYEEVQAVLKKRVEQAERLAKKATDGGGKGGK